MSRYKIVPLILLILSVINFALAVPVLIPEGEKVPVDVAHVPKDTITVLGKRGLGDDLGKLDKLFGNFGKWWGEDPESSTLYPPLSSEPLESNHGSGSMQEHAPPMNPESSTESNWYPGPLAPHSPTHSTASSSGSDYGDEWLPGIEESDSGDHKPMRISEPNNPVSDPQREEVNVGHDAPPVDSVPGPLTESGPSHTLPSGPSSESESESASPVRNSGGSSNAPATPATDVVLRRGADMS